MCGLRWEDVDLDPRVGPPVPRVRQQLVVYAEGRPAVSVPKTRASLRPVALDQGTVEVLRRHAFGQRIEKLAAGPAYADSGLVIRRTDGSPVNPTDWVTLFWKHSKRLGLPHIRFHDLRHTHATLALQAGVHPEIMSERLGHTSTSFTLDIYSHAVPSMQADAAVAVGALIFG